MHNNKRTKEQPDFCEHFRRSEPSLIKWQVRHSQRDHDILYFGYYLHDARFRTADIHIRKSQLTLPIERDCWELFEANVRGVQEIVSTRSKITISGVASLRWEFDQLFFAKYHQDSDLYINAVYFNTSLRDLNGKEELIFSGDNASWRLVIGLSERSSISFRDLKVPEFYSDRD